MFLGVLLRHWIGATLTWLAAVGFMFSITLIANSTNQKEANFNFGGIIITTMLIVSAVIALMLYLEARSTTKRVLAEQRREEARKEHHYPTRIVPIERKKG